MARLASALLASLRLARLSSPCLVKYSTHFNKKCRAVPTLCAASLRFPFINIRKRPKLCQSAAAVAATETAAATTTTTARQRPVWSELAGLVRLSETRSPSSPLSLFVGCAGWLAGWLDVYVCVCVCVYVVCVAADYSYICCCCFFRLLIFCIGKGDPANCGAISGTNIHAHQHSHTQSRESAHTHTEARIMIE